MVKMMKYLIKGLSST